ncbi:fused MFS/spermidine synthase [Microcoleus sp. FACHB-68]|uniref:spermidine synthase n=1 Tax=Microcoleus sp. FACHB-68 TaxID=2692826 RepID=UPI0016867DFC|nr:fused MFS/spermidine synthase [Microcoleus sp. FACHB-68]MBD1940296.1 fused MFS/spermidine synthase [Microcoleus sp. FACHB-68]
MLILFSLTLFVSAFLLFCVQLMVAKMILPLLGGSPSVWNTCQFFFQATLLAGYGYSHLTTKWLGVRRQSIFHIILLLLPIAFLPITLATGWLPPHEANPIPWLLALLGFSVGVPFFVVSTSAPLIQKWFAGTDNPAGSDPYFLYAASNLGSMLGLLSYPIFIEPNFSLTRQSWLWAAGYGMLLLLTVSCAVYVGKSKKGELEIDGSVSAAETAGETLTRKQQIQWILLSFIPSSLLLGVTTYLTTDLAAIPLLWAVPLALYLLTFILTFARKPVLPHNTLVTLLPLLLAPLIILSLLKLIQPLWLLLPLHLLVFFLVACVFHGNLARSRPSAKYLTGFYFWISFGGVLGGLFNAIAAPLLFPTVLEYPLLLLLSLLLLPNAGFEEIKKQREEDEIKNLSVLNSSRRNIFLISLGLLIGALLIGLNFQNLTANLLEIILSFILLLVIYYAFNIGKIRLGAGLILIVMLSQFSLGSLGGVLYTERSFFGVNRVVQDRHSEYHSLLHGTTLHGKQSLDPERKKESLTYYHNSGPVGQAFNSLNSAQRLSKVAVLGLGIGTLAAYSEPGQEWTFYEIDSAVEKLARNADYFTFLANSKAPFSVILGDARLRFLEAPNNYYDIIVMDAFSSDSIPVHLVTREAIQLYFSKLTSQGLLVINISNRYINLEPVLGKLAENLNLVALRQLDRDISPAEKAAGKSASHWVVFARSRQDFGKLNNDPSWQPIPKPANVPLWTDEFSNIFSVLRLKEQAKP